MMQKTILSYKNGVATSAQVFPSKISTCAYGKCLVARDNLPAGTIVQQFTGPIVDWEDVPESEICHALLVEDGCWLIPTSAARYISHSCDPNCIIDENNTVVTFRPVTKGQQITVRYNVVKTATENPGKWDPRWTFKCQCGAPNCPGLIHKYVWENGAPWIPPKNNN